MTALGDRLRQLRTTSGYSVRDLADRLGKTGGYISRIEVRGEIPSPELLCAIADIFKVAPEGLLQLAKADQIVKTERDIDAKHASTLSLYRKTTKR